MSPLLIGFAVVAIIGLGFATWRAPRLSSAVLWALVAAIFSTSALLMILPPPFIDKALWLAMLFPLIWVGFQFWCYWDARRWRVAAGLLLISLASGTFVLLGSPKV